MIQALWGGQDPCGLRPREDNGKARGRQWETKYGKFLLTLWNWILLRRGVALLPATVDCRTFPLVVNVGSLRHGLSGAVSGMGDLGCQAVLATRPSFR